MKQIFHRWERWECYRAGFYKTVSQDGLDKSASKQKYADFLASLERFEEALKRVINEWPVSCEHFLSNENINRIAWLGQASMCISTGTPHVFKGGFFLLDCKQQAAANALAKKYLTLWLAKYAEKNSGLREDLGSQRLC